MTEGINKMNNCDLVFLLLQTEDITLKCLKNSLEFVEENQLFNAIEPNKLLNLISTVNVQLHNENKNRLRALLILQKIISQCSTDTIFDNSVSWMLHCTKFNPTSINTELEILNQLIEKTTENPDVKKQVSNNVLPRFVDRLSKIENISESTTILILKCVQCFLDKYMASCGLYRNQFQKYVLYCLREHSENNEISFQASLCFVSLCHCGTKGQDKINYKEIWMSQFNTVLLTCHKLCDNLFDNIENSFCTSTTSTHEEKILFDLLDTNNLFTKNIVMRFYFWKTKFAVLAQILQSMLLCKFPVNKSFQPNEILKLICRIMSINCSNINAVSETNDTIALKANIPDIHSCALDVLQSLILCANRNLIPYGTLICKLCLQSLKWTQSTEYKYGSLKCFMSLRNKAYNVLSSWLCISDSSSSVEFFINDILFLLVSDIDYPKPVVKMMLTKQKKRNKRKRYQLLSEISTVVESSVIVNETANKNICCAAHECVQLILRSASIFMKWEQHKYLQSIVISLLLQIMKSNNVSDYPIPYSDVDCRLMLFRTLFTLVLEPHPKWTSPISFAIKILNFGSSDVNAKISNYCKEALNNLNPIIHPHRPTLYFADEDKYRTPRVNDLIKVVNETNNLFVSDTDFLNDTSKRMRIDENQTTENEVQPSELVYQDNTHQLKDKDISKKIKTVENQATESEAQPSKLICQIIDELKDKSIEKMRTDDNRPTGSSRESLVFIESMNVENEEIMNTESENVLENEMDSELTLDISNKNSYNKDDTNEEEVQSHELVYQENINQLKDDGPDVELMLKDFVDELA